MSRLIVTTFLSLDGGGTSWYADLAENLQVILLTQVLWSSAEGPPVYHDF